MSPKEAVLQELVEMQVGTLQGEPISLELKRGSRALSEDPSEEVREWERAKIRPNVLDSRPSRAAGRGDSGESVATPRPAK
mmetsp:Transcript_8874/g.21039  ORF Transcript_8874/g.21039 Transcript_8874/m.21039 type:complete len:81 (+) Transcript_8874:200-442(+)